MHASVKNIQNRTKFTRHVCFAKYISVLGFVNQICYFYNSNLTRSALLDCVSCVLFCSSHAMTSSVIYYRTDARKNEIYLLNSEWTVGPLSSATCPPMFIQFTGCHQLVQRFYWPENAIDWLREC